MARVLSSKSKNPFAPDQVVVALRTFAHQDGVVHQGETYRGADPVVVKNFSAFVDGETLPSELENPFSVLPDPPQHAPAAEVRSTSIPVWRQVVCTVDTSLPARWSPDSPGAASGAPPPFLYSTLRIGQILDCLSEPVRQHPSWFRWPARDVTPEDIERLERHEPAGGEHG
jgi:hypothetical protein